MERILDRKASNVLGPGGLGSHTVKKVDVLEGKRGLPALAWLQGSQVDCYGEHGYKGTEVEQM